MLDSQTFSSAAAARLEPESEKRNSGRTGPTSPEGRAASSRNAVKHGACSRTLVLPGESEEAWERLLGRWCKRYQPVEDSLEYDFVLKTAQAEWQRLRTQRNLDSFMRTTDGTSNFNWHPDQIKQHDLALRYKTSAERAFQREYRLLEQHYKIHRPKKVAPPESTSDVAQASQDPGRVLSAGEEDPGNSARAEERFASGQTPVPKPFNAEISRNASSASG